MIDRRSFTALVAATAIAAPGLAPAQEAPAPFDTPEDVTIALVRYLSAGDFFQAYLAGVREQADALGVNLRVFDSQQQAALQADMVDQAIALGVDGIVIQHGLTESMQDAAARAVEAGIDVVAFDVNVENPDIPQIEQSDRDLARLSLEQAIRDNGEEWKAAYVYVPGIAPLDRRDETWREFKERYQGIEEVAQYGTLDNPIPNSVADQGRSVFLANPGLDVVFAPYDAFAKGVKIAAEEAGVAGDISIYSADISTSDIEAMREAGSPWAATAATNPKVVGRVSVRALAMLMAGEDPGANVTIPPTLITRDMLIEGDITNMQELGAGVPAFASADVAAPGWMPRPTGE